MAIYFLDTSAVVKRDVQETGTAWVRNLANPAIGHFLDVARITDVEMTSALARRRRQASLNTSQAASAWTQFRKDFAQDYRVAEITISLLQSASLLADRHVLRAYDSGQSAGALEIFANVPTLVRVSADADLNAVAIAEELSVKYPNMYY